MGVEKQPSNVAWRPSRCSWIYTKAITLLQEYDHLKPVAAASVPIKKNPATSGRLLAGSVIPCACERRGR